jgi:hypothetical protein
MRKPEEAQKYRRASKTQLGKKSFRGKGRGLEQTLIKDRLSNSTKKWGQVRRRTGIIAVAAA